MDQIAEKIGCKTPNIYKMRKKQTVDIDMLDKVCRALNVNPLIFFESDILKNSIPENTPIYKNQAILGKAVMNIGMLDEIKYLKEQLAGKERELSEKERFIQFLLNGKEGVSDMKI